MKKMLITGGTVFVSQFAALYFREKYEVYVLNRNSRPQVSGVALIEGDRHRLGQRLKGHHFDAVLDITAYDAQDVNDLLDALGSFDRYILISSSAVYPESAQQPFSEETPPGENRFWGKYGTDKIAAEQALLSRVRDACILRPPYLYGPGNNVYREAFCFDCARENRIFRIPGEGKMGLQFFHVEDLCRFAEILLDIQPVQRIFNVGNPDSVSVLSWVQKCYEICGKQLLVDCVSEDIEQRNYFPFYNYEYRLDVSRMLSLMPDLKPLEEGLRECALWYRDHEVSVRKKPLIAYMDQNM